MIERGNLIIYTADDEEPKCVECDYFVDGFDCDGSCGAEHGWYGYNRTERCEHEEM